MLFEAMAAILAAGFATSERSASWHALGLGPAHEKYLSTPMMYADAMMRAVTDNEAYKTAVGNKATVMPARINFMMIAPMVRVGLKVGHLFIGVQLELPSEIVHATVAAGGHHPSAPLPARCLYSFERERSPQSSGQPGIPPPFHINFTAFFQTHPLLSAVARAWDVYLGIAAGRNWTPPDVEPVLLPPDEPMTAEVAVKDGLFRHESGSPMPLRERLRLLTRPTD
jgi:hypothetical protein